MVSTVPLIFFPVHFLFTYTANSQINLSISSANLQKVEKNLISQQLVIGDFDFFMCLPRKHKYLKYFFVYIFKISQ